MEPAGHFRPGTSRHQNNVPVIEVKVLVQRTVQITNLDQEIDLNYLQTDLFEESLSKYCIDANSLLSFVKHIHHHNNLTATLPVYKYHDHSRCGLDFL